jgi:hypothetical protein
MTWRVADIGTTPAGQNVLNVPHAPNAREMRPDIN